MKATKPGMSLETQLELVYEVKKRLKEKVKNNPPSTITSGCYFLCWILSDMNLTQWSQPRYIVIPALKKAIYKQILKKSDVTVNDINEERITVAFPAYDYLGRIKLLNRVIKNIKRQISRKNISTKS